MTTRIELTREQLYEKVWAIPMSKLSKELGISDVGLAKLCRRYNIPTPGLGYWAKLAHGYKVPKPPLLAAEDTPSQPIEFVLHEKVVESIPDDIAQFKAKEVERIHALSPVVKDKELKRIKQLLFGGPADWKPERTAPWVDWVLMGHYRVPRVNVGRENWIRARELVVTLVAMAEACGYRLEMAERGRYFLTVFEARIQIAIREKAKKIDTVLPARSKWEHVPFGESKFRYVPIGKLSLSISDAQYAVLETKWTDTEGNNLEHALPSVLDALVDIAARKKLILRQKREEEEERRRQAIEMEQQEEEERKQKAIFRKIWAEVEAWEKSDRLRVYIKARTERERERREGAGFTDAFKSWLAWSGALLEKTDPLTKPISDDWIETLLEDLDPWESFDD